MHSWLILSSLAVGHGCGTKRSAIDIGANDGRGIAVLTPLPIRRLLTGVTAFEMNEGFARQLRRILSMLPDGELQQAAAWTHDRGVDASIQLPGQRSNRSRYRSADSVDRPDSATGSSVVVGGVPLNPQSKCGAASWCSTGTRRQRVPSIDLAAWLRQRFCPADLVIIKLDIEGGEWELLEHLLSSGTAPLIDYMSVEWHLGQRAPRPTAERRQLKKRQHRIGQQLSEAGVRTLHRWDAEKLHLALTAATNETSLDERPAGEGPHRTPGRCDTGDAALDEDLPAVRITERCCARHPRALGCSSCRWRTRAHSKAQVCFLRGRRVV